MSIIILQTAIIYIGHDARVGSVNRTRLCRALNSFSIAVSVSIESCTLNLVYYMVKHLTVCSRWIQLDGFFLKNCKQQRNTRANRHFYKKKKKKLIPTQIYLQSCLQTNNPHRKFPRMVKSLNACLINRLFQYVSVIVLLLIGKCSLCLLVVFWPHLLGVDVKAPRLLRALQRSYALPGREQFTAAIDLAQTSVSNFFF